MEKTLSSLFAKFVPSNYFVLLQFDHVIIECWNKLIGNDSSKHLDYAGTELAIEQLLSTTALPTPIVILKLKLLQLLSRLIDGESYQIRHDPDPKKPFQTTLESAICIFEDIMEEFPDRKEQTVKLKIKMWQQVIFVCCRDGNFILAKSLYDLALLQVNASARFWEFVREVVDSENSSHPALEQISYSRFCKGFGRELDFLISHLGLRDLTLERSDENFNKRMLMKLLNLDMESWMSKKDRDILYEIYLKNEDDFDEELESRHLKDSLQRLLNL